MSKLKTIVILILILIAGTVLRFYHNTDISLWHDEAFSALLIKYPWQEMMYRIGLDVHPPMYYIFLRGWVFLFGNSLLALRSFSVFFGIATALAGYAFVKTAFKSEKAAITTALLIAINPFQIQYALEARMYTFGAFFALLAAFFLVKALGVESEKWKVKSGYFILLGVTCGILILTHYYLLFTVAAICVYALCHNIYYYKWNIRNYFPLFTFYFLLIISFLPWLKTFLFQFKQVGSGYWIPPMDKWSIPTTIWQILVGIEKDISQKTNQLLIIADILFTVFFLIQFLRKIKQAEKWLVILALVAPFGGAILFALLARLKGETSSVYLVRYFLYASSFFLIALGVWFSSLRIKWISYLLLTVYCLLNFYAFTHYWKNLDIKTKPGMNGAIKLLQNNVAPQDKLYVGSSFEFFNLKYYISQLHPKPYTLHPLLYSGGNTSIKNLPHYAGTAILKDDDLLPRFEDGAKQGDTVWLLWTNGFGGSKPETPKSWTQNGEWSYADVRPYVGTYIYITKYKVNDKK